MIIRYIKHLILITSRRNSFHTCVGLARLIYDYTAGETMAIYDLVFQDPDTSTRKSDAYYRARKSMLLEELSQRFDGFVKIEERVRGERRFQADPEQDRFAPLLAEYLSLFTPWETSCELPAHLDAWTTVNSLQFSQPNQIHSLIHPSCFARIIKALKLDSPITRLALPQFFLVNGDRSESGPPRETAPMDLTPEEASELRNAVADEERRRKKFNSQSLTILVDGIERVRLNLLESSRVSFEIEETATLIEIVGHDQRQDMLLASHILDQEDSVENQRPDIYSILLEGGQSIVMTTRASTDSSGYSVDVRYRETKLARVTALWWRRLKYRSFAGSEEGSPKGRALAPAAIFGILVLITAGALVIYLALRSNRGEFVAQQQSPPTASVESGRITEPQDTSIPKPRQTPALAPDKFKTPSSNETPRPGGTTREPTTAGVKSILETERIYIEPLGHDSFSQRVRQRLHEDLRKSGRFVITDNVNEADTAISGSATRMIGQRAPESGEEFEVGTLKAQLLNVSGKSIWRSKVYRGTAAQVVTQFTRDLFASIEREKRRSAK